MDFKEFTEKALRTESKVEYAKVNLSEFLTLLELYTTIGKLLDYIKKGMFYSNYSKYDQNYEAIVNRIYQLYTEFRANKDEQIIIKDTNFRLIHGLLGAVTEASELSELLVKYLKNGELDKVGIGEEFSDIDWYKAVTFDELGIDEEVARTNVIDKLRVRYPEKYSDELAANRQLEEEREKLEQNM